MASKRLIPSLRALSSSPLVRSRPVALANKFDSAVTPVSRSMATITYSPPAIKIGEPAPTFSAGAVVDGEITSLDLAQYKGKYVVLLFYPKDFTFVCPTEIIAFSDAAPKFEAMNTQVIALSTDTEESHLAWIRTARKKGGLGHMQIPIVADTTKEISADYGVLIENLGIALRGLFIINPEGVLEQITVNNLPVGRSVDETIRLIQAFQFVAEHGEVCPANWQPGEKTMVPDPDASLDYFSTGATEADEEDPMAAGEKVVVLNSPQDYYNVIKEEKVVVDFVAPWCGKCRQIMPLVNKLSEAHPGVTFAKFDTTEDALSELSAELGIKALPAFHFFEKGNPVGEPITGYKKKLLTEQVEKMSK
eukprot:CAMPEP_0117754654 /NCGR_PEP_ID=MMETSP0947-20121206/12950_1 /TAXON_ID=44440 /ORGANISM="Chattonella subsalsa, Strain CCMP2191" /LENGTH=362 /DNA_ID=CAMNT_0005573769 /DNA_START=108 /DNA_END=1196 /DNA_ORIENTATION=+